MNESKIDIRSEDDPIYWDEAKLKTLIQNQIRESLTLEYKEAGALWKSDGKKREISKDVSSFANSAGGVIIYGIKEDDHLPVSIDGIDPSQISREWLDQVISSNIRRKIDGLRINQVMLSDQKVTYVVVIPQSGRAPHMANDNRYYKRSNCRSVPMEEYEVRDVANRASGPHLVINMWLESEKISFKENEILSQPFQIRANVSNNNVDVAEHAIFHICADSRLQGNPSGFTNKQELGLSINGAEIVDVNRWQCNWGMGKMPIWQGVTFNLFDSSFMVRIPKGVGTYLIAVSAKAPRMVETEKLYSLETNEDNNNVGLRDITSQMQEK
ncbi:MAG: AlbA family DNA-binding domain-containing protein [Acidithiobacillus ferrivorans]